MKICTKCQQPKPATKQFFYVYRNGLLRNECIKCISERAAYNYSLRQARKLIAKELLPEWIERPKARVIVDAKTPQKVMPNYPDRLSEYHKAMETLERNPNFFRWLCSGENYYHKFAK